MPEYTQKTRQRRQFCHHNLGIIGPHRTEASKCKEVCNHERDNTNINIVRILGLASLPSTFENFYLDLDLFFFFYVYECLIYVWMYKDMPGASVSQKRATDFPLLELKRVVCYHIGAGS